MGIKELSESIVDIEEPASFTKILQYKELLDEEDEEYMQLLVEKLQGQEIYWDRPSYQNTNSLTRPLKEDGDSFKQYQTGPMLKMERDKINENWKNFIQEFDVPDKPNSLIRWKNKTKSKTSNSPEECVRRFITAYLARGLERTLYQVFRHISSQFGIQTGGPYSLEEQKLMDVCFLHKPQQAVTILSRVLNREPRGLYTRLLHVFKGKPVKKRIKWSIGTAERYVKLLMKYSGLSLEELKNTKIEMVVWLKLERKFHQHHYYLQRFWQESLHPQLFVKKSWKLRKLRRKVFKKLKEKPYQVWSDIRWKDVANELPDGFTPRFLYVLCYKVVGSIGTAGDLKSKPLHEVIDIALERLQTKTRYKKKRMRTLGFNEKGRLQDTRNEILD